MANNKDKSLELALEALEKIATHEKECGERWTEAMIELMLVTSNHAERWEKLAWLVIGTVGTTGVAAWAAMFININQ